jgi:hypothetical protein
MITKIYQTNNLLKFQSMVQSGIGSVAETTTTILKIKEQLKVQSSTLFPMLVSPTQINDEQHIKYKFYY